MPPALVEHDRERVDGPRSRLSRAGLEVPEPHGLTAVERASERFERGVADAEPRRIADDRLAGLDPQRAKLGQGTLRVVGERGLAPDLGREPEQRDLVGREPNGLGELVAALRDAVAEGLVVARAVGRLDGLE